MDFLNIFFIFRGFYKNYFRIRINRQSIDFVVNMRRFLIIYSNGFFTIFSKQISCQRRDIFRKLFKSNFRRLFHTNICSIPFLQDLSQDGLVKMVWKWIFHFLKTIYRAMKSSMILIFFKKIYLSMNIHAFFQEHLLASEFNLQIIFNLFFNTIYLSMIWFFLDFFKLFTYFSMILDFLEFFTDHIMANLNWNFKIFS